MDFKAVLFDLDGTLLDTLDDLADAVNAALAGQGLPTHPVEAYKIFVGNGAVTLVTRTLPEDQRTEENIAACYKEFQAEYQKRWDAKTQPYEGIADMLTALTARGLKLTVLSNKPHDFTQLCVKRYFGDTPFEIVQGVADDCLPKPDPAGAKAVAAKLDISPEEFLYVGDTNTDMQTANAAGMYAVGVTWGFRSAEELTEHGAKTLIDHPSELQKLL
ncbi:MAG: HAD family hydrolase [Phycisphaerae bacterium]|nr:HAD family hydrolase [Phycisphaerae bacterium]